MLKPYTLQEKQLLVRNSARHIEPMHQHMRLMEGLFRTGMRRDLNSRDFAGLTPNVVPGSVIKAINLTLPHIALMCTSIISRDPQMLVTAIGGQSSEADDKATYAQAVLRYFMLRTDAFDDMKAATEDMLKTGNGFVKVGYQYISKEYVGTPEGGDGVQLTYDKVEVDDPYVEYVSPYDILVPIDARRMDSTPWVAQVIRVPVRELRDKYGEDVVIQIDGTIAPDQMAQQYDRSTDGMPDVLAYAVVYEFYDMITRELSIFQANGKEELHKGPIPYQHRYPPFVHFRNHNDGGMQFWCFGDIENIAGPQLWLNEMAKAEVDDVKRSGTKYAIRKKHLTPDIKKQLESPIPDQVVVFDVNESVDLNSILVPIQRIPIPGDVWTIDQKMQDAMVQILGINDFQAGGVGADRMSATVGAIVDGVATLRAQDQLASVESAISGVGIRTLLLMQEFLDDERAIKIAGPGGNLWLGVSKADIEGEFSVRVEGGSTRALNPATRAQRGVQIVTTIIPMLQGMGMDTTNAARQAIRDMGLDPNYLMVPLEPEPAPEEAPVPEMPAPEAPVQEPQPQSPATMGSMEEQLAALQALSSGQQPVDAAQGIADQFGGPGVPGSNTGTLAL